jgi:hypothetical protein
LCNALEVFEVVPNVLGDSNLVLVSVFEAELQGAEEAAAPQQC